MITTTRLVDFLLLLLRLVKRKYEEVTDFGQALLILKAHRSQFIVSRLSCHRPFS